MTITQLEQIAINALRNAYQVHEQLGNEGEELVQKNRFGDTALKMDIEAEKAIIDTLREGQVPIRIISEEHGTVEITDNPLYLGLLDGLDGSNVYKSARGRGRYGTMFGIFSNLDPTYDDYLFSGIMEHSTQRLLFATKGNGSHLLNDNKRLPIQSTDTAQLNQQTRIYVDESFEINKETFSAKLREFKTIYLASSAVYYADVASGNADLVLECTRKGNLEIAIAYGLETEAGAVMITLDGVSLKGQKYLEFGQDRYIPVITASTKELAQRLIEYIRFNQ
jgi:fructose-1,6-bisphosphatase/inositol monophosphatase family enzyme